MSRFKLFILPVLLFTAVLTVVRVYFFYLHSGSFTDTPVGAIAAAFLQGVRFDISTAAMVCVPFTIWFAIPFIKLGSIFARGLLVLLTAFQAALIVYLVIDAHYFSYVQRHLTFELKYTWKEADMLWAMAMGNYMSELAGVALATFLFFAASHFIFNPTLKKFRPLPSLDLEKPFRQGGTFLLAAILTVVMIRGGLQNYPLDTRHAFTNERVELGMLSLNGIYSTISSFTSRFTANPFEFANDLKIASDHQVDVASLIVDKNREESVDGYPLYRSYIDDPGILDRSNDDDINVVVFFMESMTARFTGATDGIVTPSPTPYFDSLAKDGLLFTKFVANAQRSIQALSAFFGAIPQWEGMVLGESGLLYQTRLITVGKFFKDKGYETWFFHGTEPGILDLDQLIKRVGFEWKVHRDNFSDDSPSIENDKALWGLGIYDIPFFENVESVLAKENKRPFFSVLFSLTSHPPYLIPDNFPRKYEKSEFSYADYLNSLNYADKALETFFVKAKEAPYFENTLFIIVGDHVDGASVGASGGGSYEGFNVPCLFYMPGKIAPGKYEKIASHSDLFPTIIDILGFKDKHSSFGKSAFVDGERTALLPWGDMLIYVKDPYLTSTDYYKNYDLVDINNRKALDIFNSYTNKKIANEMKDEAIQQVKFFYELVNANNFAPPLTKGNSKSKDDSTLQ